MAEMTHYWRIRAKFPERHGEQCRMVARGKMNSCLLEFADGWRVITSRNFVRKLPAIEQSSPQTTLFPTT